MHAKEKRHDGSHWLPRCCQSDRVGLRASWWVTFTATSLPGNQVSLVLDPAAYGCRMSRKLETLVG